MGPEGLVERSEASVLHMYVGLLDLCHQSQYTFYLEHGTLQAVAQTATQRKRENQ